MKEYANATEDANKETKKLKYLISGFDELNIYSSNKSTAKSDATQVDPSKMFT